VANRSLIGRGNRRRLPAMTAGDSLFERLTDLSRKNQYDVRARFTWPAAIEGSGLWCNESLLTSFGTEVHEPLGAEGRAALSKWEAINFFSLNVHGIKDAMAFLCQKIYDPEYRKHSEYMHFFIQEENDHLWFFSKFCLDYAGKIYPSRWPAAENEFSKIERELLMFCSILIFEEFVDFYNKKVGADPSVDPILRAINHQHHLDESRHVAFGRHVVAELLERVLAAAASDRQAKGEVLGRKVRAMFEYFIGIMYNPSAYADAGVARAAGFPTAIQLRNHLRHAAGRKAQHELWFGRTARFFGRLGLIEDPAFLTAL
jgi:P-aminobenzoate N-oxygenase AurF